MPFGQATGNPMSTRRPGRLLATFLPVLLGLAACSGGGGPAAPTVDLSGYWRFYMTPTGSPEIGPSPVFLSQTGAALDGAAISGTVSGNGFTVTSSPGPFVLSLSGSASPTLATGNLAISGGINANGTFRMVKFVPTGTMSATGTVAGQSVTMTGATAIGSRDYSDASLTILEEVEIALAYGNEHLEIDFSPGGLAIGALAVPGTVTVAVVYRNDVSEVEVDATAGTLTVTKYDGTGFAGSFTLTLPGGGSLTGSFDVSWDIASFEP
jgi:hypothetical protein